MRLSMLLIILITLMCLCRILMMHLVCIRCWCTVCHHRWWWRCMRFVLHRFKMINLSIYGWFLKVIVCRRLIWQCIFCVCVLNVIIPCCRWRLLWWWLCCWCCLLTQWDATSSRTISRYSQFSIMQFIDSTHLRLRWSLLKNEQECKKIGVNF